MKSQVDTRARNQNTRRGASPSRRACAAVAALCLATLGLVASSPASATVSTDAGFEFADGNLAPQAPINFDWNSFAPTTWVGSAPYRTSSKTVSGWAFTGLE